MENFKESTKEIWREEIETFFAQFPQIKYLLEAIVDKNFYYFD
jgi:hypothetical protein